MDAVARRRLNHQVRALANGRLGLDEDTYRAIVESVDPRSGGHITRCDDEHAGLVLLQLRQMVERHRFGDQKKNDREQRKIARLMQYLSWTWKTTAEFCERQTGKRSTRLCDAKELSKIINGMVAIIEEDIRSGRLQLTPAERAEFAKHTHSRFDDLQGGSNA